MTIIAASDKADKVAKPILATVKFIPRYAKLPVSTPVAIIALFVLMMVLWLQGGLTTLYNHLYLLIGSYFTWGILLPFLQGIVEVFSWKETKKLVLISFWIIAIILFHFLVSNVIYYGLQFLFSEAFALPSWVEIKSFLAPSLLSRLVDFILFFGLLSWVNQTKDLSAKEIELAQTETQLQKSRLDSLKSQLNPHFLFNTMHAISSLIGIEDKKARAITLKISSLLRKTLAANEKSFHSLESELDIVNDYLAIESERFNDRLTVKLKVEDDCLSAMVPTMTLQPIIENAFKHGIALIEGNTTLELSIRKMNDKIQIIAINDIDPKVKSSAVSNGIGIPNLKERLNLHYGQDASLSHQAHERTFSIELQIPIR